EVARVPGKTDADGKATVKFQLPGHIARGDGLVTIMADDGEVTESIQKRIPIVMKALQLRVFPEGGDLIDGLPGRVFVQAKSTIGKPADVEGVVVDDRGQTVASFSTIHDGLGRFDVTPLTNRSYHVEITRPAGIAQRFALPAAKPGGCVLRSVPARAADKLQVAATCTTARSVLVEAVQRETRLASGAAEVAAGAPALLELPVDPHTQGAVRVTLFSTKNEPLAERLVYRGRGQDLKVTLTADKKSYSPRDPVKLTVRTSDASGMPVKASVGVAVVDGTVLSFADDKSAGILAHLYLEPELGELATDPIEEPNYYFSDKPEAPAAMDALLATRGYRRFEWQPVFAPPRARYEDDGDASLGAATAAPTEDRAQAEVARKPMKRPRAPRPTDAPEMPAAAPARKAKQLERLANAPEPAPAAHIAKDEKRALVAAQPVLRQDARRRGKADKAFAADRDDEAPDDQIVAWAPVRVFPVPSYPKHYSGPRTDFRETIYWNGNVQTSADGTAQVTFPVSDAITSFRATAEGVSAGGTPGAGSITLASRLPMTLDARLPLEVTSGDDIRLPVTLTNETDGALDADLTAQFGAAFQLGPNPAPGKIHLAAG
ncbi:MAG TPA: alpha-2-macroglobulin family protein, partial [Kofleriaceae bacterium]